MTIHMHVRSAKAQSSMNPMNPCLAELRRCGLQALERPGGLLERLGKGGGGGVVVGEGGEGGRGAILELLEVNITMIFHGGRLLTICHENDVQLSLHRWCFLRQCVLCSIQAGESQQEDREKQGIQPAQ